MTNELTVKNNLPPLNWGELKEQAGMLIRTGFLPQALNTPEKVIAVVLTGRELGVPMMEAIRGINIIQGKPSASPQLMLALANRTGQLEDIKMSTGSEGAKVSIKRKGRDWHHTEFGPKEAKDLGLDTKDNYKKQAPTMYQWRALAASLRVTFPDAISGLYTPDEMGAEVTVDSEGSMDIVNPNTGEVTESETTPKTGLPAPKTSTPEAVPPTTEEAPDYKAMYGKVIDMAMALHNGIPKDAEEYVLDKTKFTDKDGIEHRASFKDLQNKPKWLRTVYGKVKADYENWMKNEPA